MKKYRQTIMVMLYALYRCTKMTTSTVILQTLETSMHFCARAGNTDILMEIVKDLGPTRTQSAVNKQAKVLTLSVTGLLSAGAKHAHEHCVCVHISIIN